MHWRALSETKGSLWLLPSGSLQGSEGGSRWPFEEIEVKASYSRATLFVDVGAKTRSQHQSPLFSLHQAPLWWVRPLEVGLLGPGSEGEWDGRGMDGYCPFPLPPMVSLRP